MRESRDAQLNRLGRIVASSASSSSWAAAVMMRVSVMFVLWQARTAHVGAHPSRETLVLVGDSMFACKWFGVIWVDIPNRS